MGTASRRNGAVFILLCLVLGGCSVGDPFEGADGAPLGADLPPAPTAIATTEPTSTPEPPISPDQIAVDFGVDAENQVIRVGLNADISGPFASLVSEIVTAQQVYWQAFNDRGGYQGWTVEPVVLDSGYVNDVGIANYQQFAQEDDFGVLMITENTGSPITAAVAEQAAQDNMLLIPLSWSSLWPDPSLGAAVFEKQTNYCVEAMNGVEWLANRSVESGREPALAIVTRPGSFGDDGAAGARIAANELGIPVVFDGFVAGEDRTEIISGLVSSGATIVWATLTPGELLDVLGSSVEQGFDAVWSGNEPGFNPRIHLVAESAQAFDEFYFASGYSAPWGDPEPMGMTALTTAMADEYPNFPISDSYVDGWIEGIMAETLIRAAIDDGDLTRANMVALSQVISVDFQGLSANQSWPPSYDEAVVRSNWIYDVDVAAYNIVAMSDAAASVPGSTGLVPVAREYTGSVAANYVFAGPCI